MDIEAQKENKHKKSKPILRGIGNVLYISAQIIVSMVIVQRLVGNLEVHGAKDTSTIDTKSLQTQQVVSTENTPSNNIIEISSGKLTPTINWALNFETDTDRWILDIEGTGDMGDYLVQEVPWYEYSSTINEINISSGITRIGDYNFYGMLSLDTINFSDSKDLKEIGHSAFMGAEELKELTIPDGVEYIDYNAITDTGLEVITFPASLKQINDQFLLQDLRVVDFNGPYPIIGGVFRVCLEEIERVSYPSKYSSDYEEIQQSNKDSSISTDSNKQTYSQSKNKD